MRMPFGKHKGEQVNDLPLSYLEWLRDNVELFGALKDEVNKTIREATSPTPDIDYGEVDRIVGGWPCPPITL